MRPCPESRAHSGSGSVSCHSPNSFCWGSILEKKSWPHSLAAPLNSVAGLCVQAPGLVLLLSSVAGLSCWALSLCCCLGRAPELPGSVVLSSSCPCLGRPPELCGWSLWPGLLERSVPEQIAMSMPTNIIDEAVCSWGRVGRTKKLFFD